MGTWYPLVIICEMDAIDEYLAQEAGAAYLQLQLAEKAIKTLTERCEIYENEVNQLQVAVEETAECNENQDTYIRWLEKRMRYPDNSQIPKRLLRTFYRRGRGQTMEYSMYGRDYVTNNLIIWNEVQEQTTQDEDGDSEISVDLLTS